MIALGILFLSTSSIVLPFNRIEVRADDEITQQTIINNTTKYYNYKITKDMIKQRIKELNQAPVEQPVVENTVQLIPYDVPGVDTSFKSYTDYRCITSVDSDQYQIRMNCYTDDQGMRRLYDNDDYIIALGTYYTSNVGDRFLITLDTGDQFYATVGDVKADKDTDSTHRFVPKYDSHGALISANVIEFHIDKNAVEWGVRNSGSVGYYDEFAGNIISIEQIVE